jgi:endonuclease-3
MLLLKGGAFMKKANNRITKIIKILKTAYPNVKTHLRYANPFELLVATILSAQCTDKQVNKVTPSLFAQLKTPQDFSAVPIATLEELIRSTGFFRNKAKNIKKCSLALVEKHDGQVPDTMAELVKLPGVGRKTANCVLGSAFKTQGIVVDTHVGRLAQRLGLTAHKDAVKIEFDLMALIPTREWHAFSLRLINFGRDVCKARKPDCPNCPLEHLCPFPEKPGA